MVDTKESGWGLLVRFEDQSPSYCYGFEAGKVWRDMELGTSPIETTFREENLHTLSRMADTMKYQFAHDITSVEGWLTGTFTFIGSDPVKKRLQVVHGGIQ